MPNQPGKKRKATKAKEEASEADDGEDSSALDAEAEDEDEEEEEESEEEPEEAEQGGEDELGEGEARESPNSAGGKALSGRCSCCLVAFKDRSARSGLQRRPRASSWLDVLAQSVGPKSAPTRGLLLAGRAGFRGGGGAQTIGALPCRLFDARPGGRQAGGTRRRGSRGRMDPSGDAVQGSAGQVRICSAPATRHKVSHSISFALPDGWV